MGALYSLGSFFVAPFATFTLRAKLMGALLRFKKSDRNTDDSDKPFSKKNVFDLKKKRVDF